MDLPDFNDMGGPTGQSPDPAELADELHMKRQEVIGKCVEMGVPIFHGRIDKTLFETSLRSTRQPGRAARGHRAASWR